MVLPNASAPGYLLQRLRRCSSTTHGFISSHPPPVNSGGENFDYSRGEAVKPCMYIYIEYI